MLRSITTGVPGVLWLQKSLFSSFYVGKIHKFRITKVSVRNTMYIIKAWCYNLDTSKAHFQGCYVEPEAIKMILRDHAIGSYRSSTLKMKSIKKYFENHSSAVCVFPKTVVIMDNHQTLVIQLIPHIPFKCQIMLPVTIYLAFPSHNMFLFSFISYQTTDKKFPLKGYHFIFTFQSLGEKNDISYLSQKSTALSLAIKETIYCSGSNDAYREK